MSWRKSRFNHLNGKLTLTNRRLIFDEDTEIGKMRKFELSLRDITSVNKESRGTL